MIYDLYLFTNNEEKPAPQGGFFFKKADLPAVFHVGQEFTPLKDAPRVGIIKRIIHDIRGFSRVFIHLGGVTPADVVDEVESSWTPNQLSPESWSADNLPSSRWIR